MTDTRKFNLFNRKLEITIMNDNHDCVDDAPGVNIIHSCGINC